MTTEIRSIELFVRDVQQRLGLPTLFAGGAVRDLLHGKEPKDFDLFLMDGEDFQMYEEIMDRIKAVADDGVVTEYQKYMTGSEALHSVVHFEVQGRPFDFIVLDAVVYTPADVVKTFDLNLNQVWLDEDGFYAFYDYLNYPIQTQLVQLTDSPDLPSIDRIEALMERYPEYDWDGVFIGLGIDYV